LPIFEYECYICGFRTERIEFTPNPIAPVCPRCEKDEFQEDGEAHMWKVPSVSSFQLKGDGWTRPSSYHNCPQGTHPVRGPKRGPSGEPE
jgi:putative FmdB family regulatory protein